jgi:hemerythrin-like metal-binding protein
VSSELALGVASIDAQHHELIDLFDQFDRAIKLNSPLERVQAIFSRAITRANAHFEFEEELIARTHYPKAEEHKFQHRHMRIEFTTLAGSTMAILTSDPVALQQLKDMRTRLVEHIVGPDRELVDHLKAAGIT